MECRGKRANTYIVATLIASASYLTGGGAAFAQGVSEKISTLSGSASVFTGVTHTRTDKGTYIDTSTEPEVGVSGSVGGTMESGANALALQYGGTLKTKRKSENGEQTDNSTITGASRYSHFDPGSHFDFNLGHSVNSVRNNTGFVINPSSYETRNTLSAGAGLRFYPGELSTLRFTVQGGQSFGRDTLGDQKSLTAGTEFSRRLSEQSTGSLNVSRSWSEERSEDITIDSAQLVYSREMDSGHFSVGGGFSDAETEYNDGSTVASDAVTGFLERVWVSKDWRTSVGYNRRMSDTATDLSLGLVPDITFMPDTIRLRDLVVSDSLLVTHNNQKMCSICNLGLYVEGAKLKSQISGLTTYEYRAGLNLGLQITTLQRLNFGYSWNGDAGEDADVIVDQIHRINTSWTRQLAENTSFGIQFNQSYLRSETVRSDQDQFELRFVFTHGFAMSRLR